jgi:hypothetical protein
VRCKPGFLLPVRVLSRLFRRLFRAALTCLLARLRAVEPSNAETLAAALSRQRDLRAS